MRKAALAITALTVIILVLGPGDVDEFQYYTSGQVIWRHGWPWCYCEREWQREYPREIRDEDGQVIGDSEPPFVQLTDHYRSAWNLAKDVRQFAPWVLLVDVLVLAAMLMALKCAGSWLSREVTGTRLSLRAWMACSLVLSMAVGWMINEGKRWTRERTIPIEIGLVQRWLPDWLCLTEPVASWMPDRRLDAAWWSVENFGARLEIAAISLSDGRLIMSHESPTEQSVDFEAPLVQLEQLTHVPSLRFLAIICGTGYGDLETVLPILARYPNLEILTLRGCDFTQADQYARLATFGALRRVNLSYSELSESEFRKLEASMPHIKFVKE